MPLFFFFLEQVSENKTAWRGRRLGFELVGMCVLCGILRTSGSSCSKCDLFIGVIQEMFVEICLKVMSDN